MTIWTLVYFAQFVMAVVAVTFAGLLAADAWTDRRLLRRAGLTAPQEEILSERWFSAMTLVVYTAFTMLATILLMAGLIEVRRGWVWATTSLLIRVQLVWWTWRRWASRNRLRQLVQP